jgi:protein-L-isoaspartate(D-aspartate) O-methyltransferase
VDGAAGDRLADLRNRMTDVLVASGDITSTTVEAAFRAVPRHAFLPDLDPQTVYRDEAFPTKWSPDGRPISSSSQPAIMAIMLEQLDVAPGHRVLEIGAGTGYNAALLAHLTGAGGHVTTVDIDDDLVQRAQARLENAGGDVVSAVCGDGAYGWGPGAPFDRIIVTAGAWDLAPAWREQLVPAGRLVVPLSVRGVQVSVAFQPVGDRLDSVSVVGCGFMPLRGALAQPGGPRVLGGRSGLFVATDDDRPLDTAALYATLAEPGRTTATGVEFRAGEYFWGALGLWLGLREPDLVWLSAIGPAVELDLIPSLVSLSAQVFTVGLATGSGLAVLVRPDPDRDAGEAFELAVQARGTGGDELADRLADQVRAWHAAGRPGTEGLCIRAHPAGTGDQELTGTVVDKRYSRLELTWPG